MWIRFVLWVHTVFDFLCRQKTREIRCFDRDWFRHLISLPKDAWTFGPPEYDITIVREAFDQIRRDLVDYGPVFSIREDGKITVKICRGYVGDTFFYTIIGTALIMGPQIIYGCCYGQSKDKRLQCSLVDRLYRHLHHLFRQELLEHRRQREIEKQTEASAVRLKAELNHQSILERLPEQKTRDG